MPIEYLFSGLYIYIYKGSFLNFEGNIEIPLDKIVIRDETKIQFSGKILDNNCKIPNQGIYGNIHYQKNDDKTYDVETMLIIQFSTYPSLEDVQKHNNIKAGIDRINTLYTLFTASKKLPISDICGDYTGIWHKWAGYEGVEKIIYEKDEEYSKPLNSGMLRNFAQLKLSRKEESR
jgi:hypothetical protein